MNKLTLNAAVKKYGELKNKTVEEITKVLEVDPKGYNAEEMAEIASAIVALRDKKPEPDVIDPNVGIDGLADIDYSKFPGVGTGPVKSRDYSEFQKYLQIVGEENLRIPGTLFPRVKYDWEKYNAFGVFIKDRDDDEHVYNKLVGLQFYRDKPLSITRCTPETINALNKQVHDIANRRECAIYYLLKRPSK